MTARQFKSHSLAREPLKALTLFEKSQTFEKLPNLKTFPSAAKTPISERKVSGRAVKLRIDEREF